MEAMYGSRETRLPVEAIEKTLDVLVVERQLICISRVPGP